MTDRLVYGDPINVMDLPRDVAIQLVGLDIYLMLAADATPVKGHYKVTEVDYKNKTITLSYGDDE